MGLYDEDYHEKYRKYIREKRYAEYINLVIRDLQEKIHDKNKEQIAKIIKEKFPEPDYTITMIK
jgi:hypothetical protein